MCDHLSASRLTSGSTGQAAAQEPVLPEDSADVLFTDPPYYDAFGYADLADIFLAWLKRAVTQPLELFNLTSVDDMSPKRKEIVVNPRASVDGRGKKGETEFEEQMKLALERHREIVKPSGIGIVVFAHKDTASWEALLSGVVDSGWEVTASWPIDTERPNRQRAQGAAALGSSIHLVCRPRKNPDGSLNKNAVGDWRHVLSELPERIHEWMPRLAKEGVFWISHKYRNRQPALSLRLRGSDGAVPPPQPVARSLRWEVGLLGRSYGWVRVGQFRLRQPLRYTGQRRDLVG